MLLARSFPRATVRPPACRLEWCYLPAPDGVHLTSSLAGFSTMDRALRKEHAERSARVSFETPPEKCALKARSRTILRCSASEVSTGRDFGPTGSGRTRPDSLAAPDKSPWHARIWPRSTRSACDLRTRVQHQKQSRNDAMLGRIRAIFGRILGRPPLRSSGHPLSARRRFL